MDRKEVATFAEQFEGKPAEAVVNWAVEHFGDKLAVGTSLGAEAIVIMDLVTQANPKIPFIFLDTGFHFADTLDLLDRAQQHFSANLIVARPELTPEQQAERYGDQLYFRNPEQCCEIRKIAPMRKALQGFEAWITGMRRDQTAVRAHAQPVEWDGKFGLVKINPILTWSWDDVWAYIRRRNLPFNRLHAMGYPSIGCAPCTKPVKPGEDPRAGRWAGFDKTECGLHIQ